MSKSSFVQRHARPRRTPVRAGETRVATAARSFRSLTLDKYEIAENRIKEVPILAPRGKIYDREGQLIVDNYPSFSALLLRDQMRDVNADAEKIADGLHLPVAEVLEKVRR